MITFSQSSQAPGIDIETVSVSIKTAFVLAYWMAQRQIGFPSGDRLCHFGYLLRRLRAERLSESGLGRSVGLNAVTPIH